MKKIDISYLKVNKVNNLCVDISKCLIKNIKMYIVVIVES